MIAALACAGAASASLLVATTPSYDPWAWLVWGRELAGGDLDTTAGPAWKPLPVAVTALLAPAGAAAPALWLALERACALGSLVLAAVVAARLAGRAYPMVAGAAAASGLVLTSGYVRAAWTGTSEPVLVAAALGAFLAHGAGRPRLAVALGAAAALVRPEAWPLLAAYAVVAVRRDRAFAVGAATALVAVPVLWMAPEVWGSGDALRSSERAQGLEPGAPGLADHPWLAVLGTFAAAVPTPLLVLAVWHGARAAPRREPAAAILGAGAAWVATVAVMAEAGFSGEERYLLPAAAAACVLGGAGLGRATVALGHRAGRRAALSGAALACALPLPVAVPAADTLVGDLRWDARLHHDLERAVARAGGPQALAACGPPAAGPRRFPLVAWHLRLPISAVRDRPADAAVVLRSRLRPGLPVEPTVTATGMRPLAAAGLWEVVGRCPGA